MSYLVLARKHRPQNFQSVVGQDHVVRTLINAIEQNKLHHAYLFTGTRGVGKTTLARILARCLNCTETHSITAKPCGECSACLAITQGNFFDLIEVDGASRTKVEDMRDLLENVQYTPSQGRYKVYLIDEVHMLSNHSFNALLKTLEEPPPHVIFLLATTDPQRLPITVLSRCLQFHLKTLSITQITDYLAKVLKEEDIPYEVDALRLLARAAKGSVRDALSLLDQSIAYCQNNILFKSIKTLLNMTQTRYLSELLKVLADNNPNGLIQVTHRLSEQGADFSRVLDELLQAFHRLILHQVISDQDLICKEDSWNIDNDWLSLSDQFSPKTLQQYYQIGLEGQKYLSLSPTPQSGFEMIVLQMLYKSPVPDTMQSKSHVKSQSRPIQSNLAAEAPSKKVPLQSDIESVSPVEWIEIVNAMALKGLTQEVAMHCTLDKKTNTTLYLTLDSNYKTLLTQKQQTQLTAALSRYFQKPYRIEIQTAPLKSVTPAQKNENQKQAYREKIRQNFETDPYVQSLMNEFEGNILDSSLQEQE